MKRGHVEGAQAPFYVVKQGGTVFFFKHPCMFPLHMEMCTGVFLIENRREVTSIMRENITTAIIRGALQAQDDLTKRLPQKSRINRALGWLSGLRDEHGNCRFRVHTDRYARVAVMEMLDNKDFI